MLDDSSDDFSDDPDKKDPSILANSIDVSSGATGDNLKATTKRERKELFQINTHPSTSIAANNKRDRRLKKIVMRVVEFCKKEHEEGLLIPFRFFKKRASVMTGVSLSTIHRIETIDMKEPPSPEPDAKQKSRSNKGKDGQKRVRKRKPEGVLDDPNRAKRKHARKSKAKGEQSEANVVNNTMTVSASPIQLASIATLQPPMQAFALAGTVTTAVTTININNPNNLQTNMAPLDRVACSWTGGPVGPFTMGELRDNMIPASHVTLGPAHLDANGWPNGPVGPFATGVQGAGTLVSHDVVHAYQTNPSSAHQSQGRNSPVFFQF